MNFNKVVYLIITLMTATTVGSSQTTCQAHPLEKLVGDLIPIRQQKDTKTLWVQKTPLTQSMVAKITPDVFALWEKTANKRLQAKLSFNTEWNSLSQGLWREFFGKNLPIHTLTAEIEAAIIANLNERLIILSHSKVTTHFRRPSVEEWNHFAEGTVELPPQKSIAEPPYEVTSPWLMPNKFGLIGLFGNLWEVTSSTPKAKTPYWNHQDPARVIRGGASFMDRAHCTFDTATSFSYLSAVDETITLRLVIEDSEALSELLTSNTQSDLILGSEY